METRDLLLAVLSYAKAVTRKLLYFEDEGFDVPNGLNTDPLIDIVGDAYEIPKDNTVETNACEIANETGEWPEDSYCRDWFYYLWFDVEDDRLTEQEFLTVLDNLDTFPTE